MTKVTIALDAMGGDVGPDVVVPAALEVLDREADVNIILVGDEQLLRNEYDVNHPRIEVHHASEVIAMDDLPSLALRNKKDSSMRVAINLVKDDVADACVSAGNTGALMATARFVLKTLPGIDRPAIMSELPAKKGHVHIVDLGANVDSCAETLCQFAVMGSVQASILDNIPNPRVGLLNIGSEEIKGNDQVKRTAHMLSSSNIVNYIGYVEGDNMFFDVADVVVCDGFVGNVALKTMEGTAKVMASFLKDAFKSSIYSRAMSIMAMPALRRLKKRMDPSHYNGASFVGLQGIVIKSHGGANVLGFRQAIHLAVTQARHNVPELIADKVADVLQEGAFL